MECFGSAHPEERRLKTYDKEDGQIDDRWMLFNFKHTFEGKNRIKDVPECPSCFARLIHIGFDD